MTRILKMYLGLFIMMSLWGACSYYDENLEVDVFNIEKLNNDSVQISKSYLNDSLKIGLLANLPDDFQGPYTNSVTISVPTINSPIQAPGAIMIKAVVAYTYVVQEGGLKYLLSVDRISTSMQHTTACYLIWNDLGSIYGPINIQDLDQRFVDYRIYGRITGTEGFFHAKNPANELIEYRGSFNINLY